MPLLDEKTELTSNAKGKYAQLADKTLQMMLLRPKKYNKALQVMSDLFDSIEKFQKSKTYNFHLHKFFIGLYKGLKEYTTLGEAARDSAAEDKYDALGMVFIKLENSNKSTGRLKEYAEMYKAAKEKGFDIANDKDWLDKHSAFTDEEKQYSLGLYTKKADVKNALANPSAPAKPEKADGSDAKEDSNTDNKIKDLVNMANDLFAKADTSVKGDICNAVKAMMDTSVEHRAEQVKSFEKSLTSVQDAINSKEKEQQFITGTGPIMDFETGGF